MVTMEYSFEMACGVLRRNSVVKNNADTNALSVHRLVQIEYLRRADTQRRGKYLELAIRLLRTAFPSLGDDLTLRDHWATCRNMFNTSVLSPPTLSNWISDASKKWSYLNLLSVCQAVHDTLILSQSYTFTHFRKVPIQERRTLCLHEDSRSWLQALR